MPGFMSFMRYALRRLTGWHSMVTSAMSANTRHYLVSMAGDNEALKSTNKLCRDLYGE
ncbi:hypothetical protein BN1184_CH_00730 [Pantoea ananatis]|nr:hypothetical protein BN1184_CH_00730 [Pantoea ananatis]